MTVISKALALQAIRRAYGPDFAESLAEHLPDRIDTHDAGDLARMADLGLTADGIFDALGAEL
ncbi:hypothetical protein [Actinocrispum sp. NPDC049592]|uniref:hypothetical protein n=1 Tax=Actinocrispum sp. NPDC049592 TaxID=3154835 RepID=UPI003428479C